MSYADKKVAILLATYNGEKYISEQLESIQRQTHKSFFCYIHDDGSEDKTLEIILKFCKQDSRFIVVQGPRCGSAKENFFFLLNCVHDEEYIMFCDQDDCWKANKIKRCLEAIQSISGNNAACVYSDLEVVDEKKASICPSYYLYSGKKPLHNEFPSLIMSNVVVGCTMMINRRLAKVALSEVDHNCIFMHDWWIALIASCSGEMKYIDEPLVLYRQHNDNTIGARKNINVILKLFRFLFFYNYKHNRERIRRSIDFCKALDRVIEKSYYKDLIHEMANIENHCWLFRVRFFLKHRLISYNRIGKILWL